MAYIQHDIGSSLPLFDYGIVTANSRVNVQTVAHGKSGRVTLHLHRLTMKMRTSFSTLVVAFATTVWSLIDSKEYMYECHQ